MEFRPCIDIHNGKVKQIVGGSLRDAHDFAVENFVSEKDAAFYANLYRKNAIHGAHVILLNGKDSDHYEATKQEALKALYAYPGGLMVGGGITAENAKEFIDAGASHVIVTGYLFENKAFSKERLCKLVNAVGKERLVLDLSARKRDGKYYVVVDRWQTFTNMRVTSDILCKLSESCDEFLIHGVDTEGKKSGFSKDLIDILVHALDYGARPITYAGGIASMEDINRLKELSDGRIHFTVGSALDIFGGTLSFEALKNFR